jgi:hypothetical protein
MTITFADLPEVPAAKYHRVAAYSTPSANTWHDVVWDVTNTDESTFGFNRTGAIITTSFDGIFNVAGCIRPTWNGADSQWEFVTVYVRGVTSSDNGVTWDEARCIQTLGIRARQVGVMTTLRYAGTVLASNGLQFKIQYQVDDVNMDLEGSSVFDDPVSASLHLEYISKKTI